jgi:hypothetical protein
METRVISPVTSASVGAKGIAAAPLHRSRKSDSHGHSVPVNEAAQYTSPCFDAVLAEVRMTNDLAETALYDAAPTIPMRSTLPWASASTW